MKNLLLITLGLFIILMNSASGQDKPEAWNVSNPPGSFKDTTFTVTEGTWMNLDISPDGKQIVFDLLGDIFTIPVEGGAAKVLRTGHAFEVQPRFSHDGKHISFTSDAGGGDNIWVMNTDGSAARQITKEDFRLLNNAVWSSDDQYLVARKHFTSTRSLGAGELWMYHVSGGSGVQLTKRKNDQQDLGEPSWTSDGRYIYYSEDMYPGGYFQYNKNPNAQIYVIKRYDTVKGESEDITGGNGGAVRPQISHDGKTLAFVRRVREKTVLYLRNMLTGEEWPVYDQLNKDQQEAWAIFGVYPNFQWMPNDKQIIIWAGGHFKKLNIADLTVSDIPFNVTCTHRIMNAVHFENVAAADSFDVKSIRGAVTSPDGKLLVFNGAGFLWKKNLPDGKPERLTNGNDLEFEPSFSPDGKSIIFVTWNDENFGSISTIQVNDKSKTIKKITPDKGIYRTPAFSPDQNLIAFEKENGNDHQGFSFCVDPGIYLLNFKSGISNRILKEGSNPTFSKDGKRIFFMSSEDDKRALKSIGIDGKEERTHLTGDKVTQMVPSPDEKWIAFSEYFNIYLAAFPPSGKPAELTAGMKSVPVAKSSLDAGLNLHWSVKSDAIHWTNGDQYFTTPLNERFKFVEGGPDSIKSPDSTGIKIGLRLPSDKPKGKTAITNARIITMNAERKVIENGTIVIDGNHIAEIGPAETVVVPKGAFLVDANGKTVIPGLIDVHAHLGTFRQGLSPQKQWSYYANLAYGITTTHDPSSNSEMVFSQSEMVKSGTMTGPRIFSTGWILYGAEGDYHTEINSVDDAMSAIRRTKAYGAFSVKSYNQPRREQRQMVIEAARRLHCNVVPEGGSFFYHNLSMVLDGHTGIEHNMPVAPLYNDVVSLFKASETAITPTLIVSYGAVSGEYYFYQHSNVWENEKLLRFTPRSIIDERSRHRTMIPEEEYYNGHMLVSRSLKTLQDAGVRINMGSHGQIQGIGAHWEMWMLAQGGMSPMKVLECATLNGAHYLGMDKEIGSLEKGKLADLVVLDKNPLDDIRNTESVSLTMINGRLYDTNTMNEIGNRPTKRSRFYWENTKTGNAFPWQTKSVGDED